MAADTRKDPSRLRQAQQWDAETCHRRALENTSGRDPKITARRRRSDKAAVVSRSPFRK